MFRKTDRTSKHPHCKFNATQESAQNRQKVVKFKWFVRATVHFSMCICWNRANSALSLWLGFAAPCHWSAYSRRRRRYFGMNLVRVNELISIAMFCSRLAHIPLSLLFLLTISVTFSVVFVAFCALVCHKKRVSVKTVSPTHTVCKCTSRFHATMNAKKRAALRPRIHLKFIRVSDSFIPTRFSSSQIV